MHRSRTRWLILALLTTQFRVFGYSLLTHEQIVDIVWHDHLVPLLRARYPQATSEDLRRAHAYAYGGSLIQDLGYYPFGSKLFSDLAHYVRTGDFVTTLINESTDLNEYAFALGALAHYSSDNKGHPLVNQAVAESFPKLKAKHGGEVTYADCPAAHIQTEFGFDMEQVAKHRYTSEQYHEFIGFKVAKAVLDRAFLMTYGLPLEEVLGHEDLAIGSFRRAVSQFVPELTRAALLARRPQLVEETPDFSERQFLFNLSRAEYERQWGNQYRRPGILARFLAFLWRLVPRVGRLKALDFMDPTPATEKLYIKSVNNTVEEYRHLLHESAAAPPTLQNLDCDTGRPARYGEYELADKTYAQLLERLAKHGLDQVPAALQENILSFYSSPAASQGTARGDKLPRKTRRQLLYLERLSHERPPSDARK